MKVIILLSMLALSIVVTAEENLDTRTLHKLLQDEALQNDPTLSDEEKEFYPKLEQDEIEDMLNHASDESLRDLDDAITTYKLHQASDAKPLLFGRIAKKIKRKVRKVVRKVRKVVRKGRKIVRKVRRVARKVRRFARKVRRVGRKVRRVARRARRFVRKVRRVVRRVRRVGRKVRRFGRKVRRFGRKVRRVVRKFRRGRGRGDEPELIQDEVDEPEQLTEYDQNEE